MDNVLQDILNTPQRRMQARRQVTRLEQEVLNGSPRRRRVVPSQPLEHVHSAERRPSVSSGRNLCPASFELVSGSRIVGITDFDSP